MFECIFDLFRSKKIKKTKDKMFHKKIILCTCPTQISFEPKITKKINKKSQALNLFLLC